jgi:hypothetical protein
LNLVDPGGASAEYILISGGCVGIGTGGAPGYKLEVSGDAAKTTGGSWTTSSDRRLKDVLGEYNRGLADINKLRPISFRYKENNPRNLPSDVDQVGFVAQDVREVFPEAVSDGDDGYLDFNMHAINVAVINALKELNDKLDQKDLEIVHLKAALCKKDPSYEFCL